MADVYAMREQMGFGEIPQLNIKEVAKGYVIEVPGPWTRELRALVRQEKYGIQIKGGSGLCTVEQDGQRIPFATVLEIRKVKAHPYAQDVKISVGTYRPERLKPSGGLLRGLFR